MHHHSTVCCPRKQHIQKPVQPVYHFLLQFFQCTVEIQKPVKRTTALTTLGPTPPERQEAIFIAMTKEASIRMALGTAEYSSKHTHLRSKRTGLQRFGCFAARNSPKSLVSSSVHGSSMWRRPLPSQAAIPQNANLSLCPGPMCCIFWSLPQMFGASGLLSAC